MPRAGCRLSLCRIPEFGFGFGFGIDGHGFLSLTVGLRDQGEGSEQTLLWVFFLVLGGVFGDGDALGGGVFIRGIVVRGMGVGCLLLVVWLR